MIFALFCLFAAAAPNASAEAAKGGWKDVEVKPAFQYYGVDGDDGRFRQDWRQLDGFSGGVDNLEFATADDKVRFKGKAIVLNDYRNELMVQLPSESYLKVKGKYFRQYYDGSNEPWDTAPYFLGPEFADWEDEDLYADRLSQAVEYGRAIDENTGWAIGYDLWGRFGRERLLRGEQTTGSQRARRSLPGRAYLDGLSHTFYGEYHRLIADKYNFKIRPSYEVYDDYQVVEFYRYANGNGTLSQARTWQDAPQFQDVNLQATVDRFFTDNIYFYTGYLFNYLRNQFTRSEVRTLPPSVAPTFTEPSVDNVRISNTGNLGGVFMNLFGINHLRFAASSRGEVADTSSRGYGITGSATSGNFGHKELRSDIGEYWVSESLGLTYTGTPNLLVDWGVDLDQRKLDYNEFFDAGSYESFVDFGASTRFYNYDADIHYNDLKNTIRGSYRFNRHLKSGLQYRLRYLEREYDVNVDTEPKFYPGVIGDILRRVHEGTASLDVWWTGSWSSTLKYQTINDNIHTEAGGEDVQDQRRHRVTATLIGKPVEPLTLFGSATYESNVLDTPTAGVSTNPTWFQGTDAFDYHADYFIYSVNAVWAVAKDTKVHCGFQQTTSYGQLRDIQHNVLDELRVGVSRQWDSSLKTGVDAIWFDFDDKNTVVPGFDNYDGYGIVFTCSKKFA